MKPIEVPLNPEQIELLYVCEEDWAVDLLRVVAELPDDSMRIVMDLAVSLRDLNERRTQRARVVA